MVEGVEVVATGAEGAMQEVTVAMAALVVVEEAWVMEK